jgi:hypothetical protein
MIAASATRQAVYEPVPYPPMDSRVDLPVATSSGNLRYCIDQMRQAVETHFNPALRNSETFDKLPNQDIKARYEKLAEFAKSRHIGDCAEFSYVSAQLLEENVQFTGKLFIATYGKESDSMHQILIARYSDNAEMTPQPHDIIIDSWGGWYATVANAHQYPLGFINKIIIESPIRYQQCGIFHPQQQEILPYLRYHFFWNDPAIPPKKQELHWQYYFH